ncbi:MAG: rhamnulose-1-phosphate aldolase [Bacilli bacterium]|nr:rhamnulose-1-phosphate aldolase [Bacilli bacterium]MCQ2793760.1 rhamnulose-1-phosphate aldolase [Bacilli bacterium]
MKKFIDSPFVKAMSEVTANMYRQGWDERNGGNISYLIDDKYIKQYFPKEKVIRDIPMTFAADPIVRNKCFLVTGTGKYFKNVMKDPETNLGLVRIAKNGKVAHLLWGYKGGGKFTSEFPAHIMCHTERLKVNPNNRIIMHTHPTYTMCMGASTPVSEKEFTKRLWTSNTEAIVVFPEGIGVLPCMVCGTNLIGEETAKKMRKFRIVSWTNHGIYGCGNDMDEAFGLIETVEKTAMVYMISLGHVVNVIPPKVLVGLCKLWHLHPMHGVFKELDVIK